MTSDDTASSQQLSLYFPNNLWAIGTYPLSNANNLETGENCQMLLLTNYGVNPYRDNQLVSGSVTITEFNEVTRRIAGTFSCSYKQFINGALVGEFQISNGTFNYALDDPYFD